MHRQYCYTQPQLEVFSEHTLKVPRPKTPQSMAFLLSGSRACRKMGIGIAMTKISEDMLRIALVIR